MEDTAIQEYKTSAATLVQTAQAMKVKTFENAMDAADFLLDVKQLGEKVTTRKEEVAKPMNEFSNPRALSSSRWSRCARKLKAL